LQIALDLAGRPHLRGCDQVDISLSHSSDLLFVGITSRIISSSALVSAVPDPAHRGSFMAVNSSIQQVSGGIAAAIGGLIVVEASDGSLARYDVLGYVVMASMVLTVVLMYFINRMVRQA